IARRSGHQACRTPPARPGRTALAWPVTYPAWCSTPGVRRAVYFVSTWQIRGQVARFQCGTPKVCAGERALRRATAERAHKEKVRFDSVTGLSIIRSKNSVPLQLLRRELFACSPVVYDWHA